jgi:hypothetical protein
VSASRAVTLGEPHCDIQLPDIKEVMAGSELLQGPAIVDDDGRASLPGLGKMLSPELAAKGLSASRKWGVKAHVERQSVPLATARAPAVDPPFDWLQLYLVERDKMEQLSRQAPE